MARQKGRPLSRPFAVAAGGIFQAMARRTRIPGSWSTAGYWKKASLTTSLTGDNNDLTYTADDAGAEGNDIRIGYTDPAAINQALAVTVTGNDISVSLATDGAGAITSTAAAVRDAVNAHATAGGMVTAANATGNDGTGVVTAMALTNLSGGTTRRVATLGRR